MILQCVLLGKRPSADVALERMKSTVDPPVHDQIAHARVGLRAGLAGNPNLRMDRPTVLLQGTTVHESFGTVLVGALVRPFRGVSPPVDDQVAGGAEVLAANLALENFTQFLLINTHSFSQMGQTGKSGFEMGCSALNADQWLTWYGRSPEWVLRCRARYSADRKCLLQIGHLT